MLDDSGRSSAPAEHPNLLPRTSAGVGIAVSMMVGFVSVGSTSRLPEDSTQGTLSELIEGYSGHFTRVGRNLFRVGRIVSGNYGIALMRLAGSFALTSWWASVGQPPLPSKAPSTYLRFGTLFDLLPPSKTEMLL